MGDVIRSIPVMLQAKALLKMDSPLSRPDIVQQGASMNFRVPPSEIGMASQNTYLIRVRGNVSASWLEYFDDISIVVSTSVNRPPISTICTHSADQAALLGILTRLYTFGYPIFSVECIE